MAIDRKSIRIQIGDILDRHCKPCTLVHGVHFDKRKVVCDACEIGQMLKEIGKPLSTDSLERKRKSEQFEKQEEMEKVQEKAGPTCGLTKQALIESVAAGESLSSIERAWGMKYNTIHNWLKKWELKGITADKAREMLGAVKLFDDGGVMIAESKSKVEPDEPAVFASQAQSDPVIVASGLVKLPKKAAEFIEQLRREGHDNSNIIYTFASGESYENEIAKTLSDYASDNFDTFLKALVNGYEIEPTPDEKAIEWLINQDCLQESINAHDIVMVIKRILGGGDA